MDKTNNLQHFLTDLADTIRTVEGSSEPINAQTFSTRIASFSTGGGGVPIVGSIEELEALDLPIGSLAVVTVPGTFTESSFRDLYQPDSTIVDNVNHCFTTPELLSGVSSLSFNVPPEGSVFTESTVFFAPRTFSMDNLAQFGIIVNTDGSVAAAYLCETESGFVQEEYSPIIVTDGILSLNQTDIDKINDLLTKDDWCYLSYPQADYIISEEQFDTLDLIVKPIGGIPSTGDVYIKKDEWEKLYHRDFNKLYDQLSKVNALLDNKQDAISYYTYGPSTYDSKIYPNRYYSETCSYSNWSYSLKLMPSENSNMCEYIIELVCDAVPQNFILTDENGTELSIKWANGIAPIFSQGCTYLISIANGLGIYQMFKTAS